MTNGDAPPGRSCRPGLTSPAAACAVRVRLVYSNLLHLPVLEFDGYRTAENGQFHLDRILGLQHLLDLALHAGEHAVLDLDPVALLGMLDDDLLLALLAGRAAPALHLAVGHRGGRPVERAADEVADAGGLAEQVQNTVVELDLGHDVA